MYKGYGSKRAQGKQRTRGSNTFVKRTNAYPGKAYKKPGQGLANWGLKGGLAQLRPELKSQDYVFGNATDAAKEIFDGKMTQSILVHNLTAIAPVDEHYKVDMAVRLYYRKYSSGATLGG